MPFTTCVPWEQIHSLLEVCLTWNLPFRPKLQDKPRNFLHWKTVGVCLNLLFAHCAWVAASPEPSLWLPQSHGTQECRPPWLPEPRGVPGWQLHNSGGRCEKKTQKTMVPTVCEAPFQETLEFESSGGREQRKHLSSNDSGKNFSQLLDVCLIRSLSPRPQPWWLAKRPPSQKDQAPGSVVSCLCLKGCWCWRTLSLLVTVL